MKKSDFISHLSLIIASQAVGKTIIKGVVKNDSIYSTLKTLRLVGVRITEDKNSFTVHGVGISGLTAPKKVLDIGYSDVLAHLLIGLLSTYSFTSFFTGNIGLHSESFSETIKALSSMCVSFIINNNNSFPIAVIGSDSTIPIVHTLNIPSVEVKSAILFAALNTEGKTIIVEKKPTNNYTELILKKFGVSINISKDMNGYNIITIYGREELLAQREICIYQFT